MTSRTDNIKSIKWVAITAVGFVIFVGLAVFFSIYSERFNGIGAPAFFFLLLTIGLVAAGFLFGAMRSHAAYTGKAYGGTLQLGGPVVVVALVILLGYRFRPAEQSVSATVNLFSADSSHTPVHEGTLTVYYGAAQAERKIANGQVVFSEMPKDFLGKELSFIASAGGYVSRIQKATLPATGHVIYLYLERIPDAVQVSGIVINKKGKAVRDAVVVFADGRIKDTTDKLGNFNLDIPLKEGAETNLRVYIADELVYNNLVRLSGQSPLTVQLQ